MGKYKKKIGGRQYGNFTEDQVNKAVSERLKGKSLRYLSEKYGIPKSTIDNKAKGKHSSNVGGQCALSAEEELKIRDNIVIASTWGFPLTSFDVQIIVQSYLNERGITVKPFKKNLPGKDWITGFFKRHSDLLSERWAQNVKRARASLTYETVTEYFLELKDTVKDVHPEAIVNYDESNLTDDPGNKKIICRRGTKHPTKIIDTSKQSYSVMFSGTATGHWLPPYIVYKAEHLYESWTSMGPKSARYNRSKNGWFTTELFEDWFFHIALPYFKTLKDDSPKLLIGDNLSSHLSIKVISSCAENNIRFTFLPPNSTHLSQPLDVACFKGLKVKWRSVLSDWKNKNRGTIPKDKFPHLLKKCLEEMNEGGKGEKNMVSGFSATGIFPFNPDKVLRHIPKPDTSVNTDGEQLLVSIDSAFETFMKELHQKETSFGAQKKKRVKINVPAGRSVTNLEEIPQSSVPVTNDNAFNIRNTEETKNSRGRS